MKYVSCHRTLPVTRRPDRTGGDLLLFFLIIIIFVFFPYECGLVFFPLRVLGCDVIALVAGIDSLC